VSGHGFSRAANAYEQNPFLAPQAIGSVSRATKHASLNQHS